MRGSINFRRGGGGGCSYKSYDAFLALNLFYRSPMVTFKENYHFPRFGGIFFFGGGGGGNCLFPIETHIICDFPGGQVPFSLYLEVHIFF